jgi:hypothetical protein
VPNVANWPITQKGPIKIRVDGQSCGKILADFVQKGLKKGPNFLKISFSPLIFSKFVQIKEILYFAHCRHI